MTMRRFDRFGTIAVLAFSTVWAPAFAGNVTVGQFYAELARAKRFVSGPKRTSAVRGSTCLASRWTRVSPKVT